MKKISTTLCMLALSSMMLNAAAVKNETTSVEYPTLTEAWTAAADGDVLVLNENVELGSQLHSGDKNITLKATGNVTITKVETFKSVIFQVAKNRDTNKTGSITLENLTINCNGDNGDNSALQATDNGTLNLNNVTVTNCQTTQGQGVIGIKGGGKLNATNLSVTNFTVPEGRGALFAGTNNVKLNGNCTLSVYAEKQSYINCSGLTGGKITLVYNSDRTITNPIVKGITNADLFEVSGTDYEVTLSNGELFFKEKDAEVSYPALNETTNIGYMSFDAAWDAAKDGEVIVLNEDVTISKRRNGDGRKFTVKGNGHKVSRAAGFPSNTIMFLTNSNTGNVTLENMTIDGGNVNSTNTTVESSGSSTLVLNNVTFINCTTTNGQGVVCVKGGKLLANNITIKDCNVPEGAGYVFAGSNNVILSGDCTTSVFVQGDYSINATDLTAGLITLYFAEEGTWARDFNAPFVMGNDNTALFKSGDSNYDLKASEGNILLEKNDLSSVVEGISTDEAQVVDVYSIQGVRVKAGVAAAEATEGLPAGLYIVGGKKVIVK